MSRDSIYYDEQEAMDRERRLAMAREQEPARTHHRRRNRFLERNPPTPEHRP